jgi:uncharacterized protein
MEISHVLTSITTGCIAGLIDAIAGGGGLITLPVLFLLMGAGAEAVATNKINGTVAALVAFLVYRRGGHFVGRPSLIFASWIAVGSLAGSLITGHIPPHWFAWMFFVTGPMVLFLVYRRDFWVRQPHSIRSVASLQSMGWFEPRFVAGGLVCGLYDGVWGPGGGTFMFLTLFFFGRLDLMHALTATKFVNFVSAGTALGSFSAQGLVVWAPGLLMATGIAVGAFLGSNLANRQASRVVRPVLAIVVVLLAAKVLASYA